ncbi:MAG: hypothetical protein U9R32_02085, partial [Bacteroidota bacterium]|nr:hypothetical protein [Bacteroidota bacterium]
MNIQKKQHFTIFFIAISILFSISSCSDFNKQNINPLEVIPTDASIILSTSNFRDLWEGYSKSDIWDTKKNSAGLEYTYEHLLFLDDLSDKNSEINNTLTNRQIFFSIHTNSENKTSSLLVVKTDFTISDLNSLVKKQHPNTTTITKSAFLNNNIYKIIFANKKEILFFSSIDDIFLFSYDEALIK